VPGVCVLGFGDSILAGSVPTVRGNGFLLRACAALSTMERPVAFWNQGIGSGSMAAIATRSTTLLAALGVTGMPNMSVVSVGSPNSAASTLTASELLSMTGSFQKILRNLATYAPNCKPVPMTWMPENPASNDYGSTDSLRRDYNDLIRSGVWPVLDIDSVMAGDVDGDGQTNLVAAYTSDNLHPNEAGHAAIAVVAQALLERVFLV